MKIIDIDEISYCIDELVELILLLCLKIVDKDDKYCRIIKNIIEKLEKNNN